jgi:hypothetical protein
MSRSLQGEARPVVETIFFGGGTPSLMSWRQCRKNPRTSQTLWPWANDVEITLEANPASADASRFADYRAAGVNRISLGIQALNDADLKFLGRLHNLAEAKAALALAVKTFDRVSLDLIYARPNKTSRRGRANLPKQSRSAPNICRFISSLSSRRRRSPRCTRRAKSSFPATSAPHRYMRRRKNSLLPPGCPRTKSPIMPAQAKRRGTI